MYTVQYEGTEKNTLRPAAKPMTSFPPDVKKSLAVSGCRYDVTAAFSNDLSRDLLLRG